MMRRLIPFAGKEPFAREPRRPKEPVKLVKPAHGKREKVELVTGEVYFSDDRWATVWKRQAGRRAVHRLIHDKAEADRIRFIAVVAHGGGRDEN
jgi:hypothetical protein